MVAGPSICNFLVALQKILLVMRMDQFAPEGRRILYNFAWQAELFDHLRRIPEYACLHISYKYIIIRSGDQRFIKMFFVIFKISRLSLAALHSLQPALRLHNMVLPLLDIHLLIRFPQYIRDAHSVAWIHLDRAITEGHRIKDGEFLPPFIDLLLYQPHSFFRP